MIENIKGNFLQWLRGFFFVVQFDGVSRAAKHMGLEQSAISHQIRNLESLLNVPLFIRHNKVMHLTPAGKLLYQRCIPLFEHINSILNDVGCGMEQFTGPITIATTHAIGKHFLTENIYNFRQEFPSVLFTVLGGGYGNIMDLVQNTVADFGISPMLHFPDNIKSKPLFASEIVVISPKGNPFKVPVNPTLESIRHIPFISFPPNGTIDAFFTLVLNRGFIELNRVIVANTYTILLDYVQKGMGITILDGFTVLNTEREAHLDIFRLAGVPLRGFSLITRADKYLSPQSFEFQTRLLRSSFPSGAHPFP